MRIREIELGSGMPAICASLMGRGKSALQEEAKAFCTEPIDIAEWRVDYLEEPTDTDNLIKIADDLRKCLGNIPLLFTFRSKREGGEKALSLAEYVELLERAAACREIDMVDVEMFFGVEGFENHQSEGTGSLAKMKETDSIAQADGMDFMKAVPHPNIEQLLLHLHDHGKVVIGSYHDFAKTPTVEEIYERLCFMDRHHVDIPKVAVMPQKAEDACHLLEATAMAKKEIEKPLITMSMGGQGMVSRIAGESFGSAVTFGCVGKPSAPGQIEVKELKKLITFFHQKKE